MQNNKNKLTDIQKLLSMPLPYSEDAEMAVISGAMLSKTGLENIFDIISVDDFYIEKHKIIFSAILSIHELGKPVDLLTLFEELKRQKNIEKIGGVRYVAELNAKSPSASNIESHALIVLEKSLKRQVFKYCSDTLHRALDDGEDILQVLDELKQFVEKTENLRVGVKNLSPKELADKVLELIKTKRENPDKFENLTYNNIPTMNKVTGGFEGGDLIVIAGRPSMGKTKTALEMAYFWSVLRQVPGAIFSLEMKDVQNFYVLNQFETGIERAKLRQPENLTDRELDEINKFASKYAQKNLFIVNKPGINEIELRNRARHLYKRKKIRYLILDHIGLMKYSRDYGKKNLEQAEISHICKEIAIELNIPVFILVQLNRDVTKRDGKRPQLSDLRNSGEIEEDADIVIFPHRPKYFEGDLSDPETEIIIAKNRQGDGNCLIECLADKRTKILREVDKHRAEPPPQSPTTVGGVDYPNTYGGGANEEKDEEF